MNPFRKQKSNSTTFYCFTPLVSLATFFIEIILAFFILFKYRQTLFSQVVFLLLVCLGVFQLAEYMICTTPYGDFWVKVGYISITFLPPFGLHAINILNNKFKGLLYLCYTLALILSFSIIFIPQINLQAFCEANYVSINKGIIFMYAHGTFYWLFIMAAIYSLWGSIKEGRGDRKSLVWILVSYLVFTVPTITLLLLGWIAKTSLPSVMCGFALLTALIFTGIVVPRYYEINKITKKKSSRR